MLGRTATLEDVGNVAAFVASDKARGLAEVGELVRVQHRVDRGDPAAVDVQADDVDDPALGVEAAEARLAVDRAPARA